MWVTYHVTLYKPKLYASLGYAADYARYYNTGVTVAAPYGTLNTTETEVDGDFTLAGSTNNLTLTFPAYPNPAVYSVYYRLIGPSTATVAYPTVAISTGVTQVYVVSASDYASPLNGETSRAMTSQLFFRVAGGLSIRGHVRFDWSAGTMPGGTVDSYLFVNQVSPGILN